MNERHEFVGRRVRSLDGDALGEVVAVDQHRSGKVLGARVRWDQPIATPNGELTETNVFWSRLELLPAGS